MKFANQPQKLITLIGDSYRFFPQLSPKLVYILIGTVLTNFILIFPIIFGAAAFSATGISIVGAIFLFIIAYVFIGLLNAFWAGALTTRAQEVMSEDPALADNTWSNAKSKMLRVFMLGICIFVIASVIALITFGLIFVVYQILGNVAALLFAIPVSIFAIYLSFRIMMFCLPTLILEDTPVLAAFSRSYALSQGMVWRIIITVICAAIPGWLLLLIENGLSSIMGAGFSLVILTVVIQLLATFINSILGMSSALVLFNDARLRQGAKLQ